MDDLERRLRRHAERIDASVSPELAARLQASLKSATPARPRSRASMPLSLWLAASLSGAAVAVLVVLLLPRADRAPSLPEPMAQSAPLPQSIAREFPLTVKTAELTAPLEEELQKLQADIEKARERVREDLDF